MFQASVDVVCLSNLRVRKCVPPSSLCAHRWHFDMLHDAPRNSAFRGALETAITAFTEEHKKPPLVLDIGTGSGLLSMLAVRAGASKGRCCLQKDAHDWVCAVVR